MGGGFLRATTALTGTTHALQQLQVASQYRYRADYAAFNVLHDN